MSDNVHRRDERCAANISSVDDAGAGKTTNAALAAAGRNRPHFVAFDKHAKAHEFITDPATPDDYFHLKGGTQPKHDCCMTAVVEAGSEAGSVRVGATRLPAESFYHPRIRVIN
jgi:hypothetical protein